MTVHGFHVNWPPLALALLLAVLAGWLNLVSRTETVVDDAGFTHDPDFVMARFNALAFDPQGRPHQRLTADKLTHYMDDDTTVLERPVLRQLDPLRPVTVQARRALISSDGQQIHFLDDVRMARAGQGNQPATTLETAYLHVSADNRRMVSDRPVLFRQGRSSIAADGFSADDLARQVSLNGNVRGTYEALR